MKSRPDPSFSEFERELRRAMRSVRVKRAVERLLSDEADDPRDLSAVQLAAAYAEVARRQFGTVGTDHFARAWRAIMPVLCAPEWESPWGDLREHIMAQPEMRQLWKAWDPGRPGTRGPAPDWTHAKTLLMLLGATPGITYSSAMRAMLDESPPTKQFFAALSAENAAERRPQLQLAPESPRMREYAYSRVREQMRVLAKPGVEQAWIANIAMLRQLREYHPDIGKRLLLDGTAYPAWTQQKGHVGEFDPAREAALRGRCPEAGFRMYGYSERGKLDVTPDDDAFKLFRSARARAWRGYYWITLFDQASGRCVLAVMQDASVNEFEATRDLLARLYQLWPDIDAQVLVADPAWDVADEIRNITLSYPGLSPVIRPSRNVGERVLNREGRRKDTAAIAIDEYGRVHCKHGVCSFSGSSHPSRAGLAPGEQTKPGEHRVRVNCPEGICGKISVRMEEHWNRLVDYPLYSAGRPDLYAMRVALTARLHSQVEAGMSQFKQRGLANPGACRSRTIDMREQECYMALCAAQLTALTLADQRQRRGVSLSPFPPKRANQDRSRKRDAVMHTPPAVADGAGAKPAHRAALTVLPGGSA